MWYHSISIQGRRHYNEDEYNIINNLNSKDITLHNIGYFGLFDGHGGGKISKFCKKHLHKYFLDNERCKIASKSKDYDKYINKTYISVQNKLSDSEMAILYREMYSSAGRELLLRTLKEQD